MTGPLETPGRIEPCLLDEVPVAVADLVAELAAAAATLGTALRPRTRADLAALVRIMNCYYSNLIEGHDTHPRDIERALAGEFEEERGRRNLQIEAAAHVRVQGLVDAMALDGSLPDPTSGDFVRWLHREFYKDAAPKMLRITGGSGDGFDMVPGDYRSLSDHDVAVGRHRPPASGRVPDFMAHFSMRYRLSSLGTGARVIAVAAAHHRLNFIHPFPDGNGRVSRLMSHAMAHHAGIGAGGLWSVSRGLARGLENRAEYRTWMDAADMPRQGDLDGRGNLSLRALVGFVDWFLRVCLDQVRFMAGQFDLDGLGRRLHDYVAVRGLRPEATGILDEILVRGEMPRGDARRTSGLKERTARDLLAAMVADGILGSDTPKGPVSLRFPVHAVEVLFPRLFPRS